MPEPPPPLPPSLSAWDSRTARLAVAGLDEITPALRRAIARHGADRVAMVVGTTTSGLGRTEDAYHELKRTGALPPDYELHRQHSFGAMMEALRRVAGIRGPCFVVSTACSASAKAVGCAQRLLATDAVDAVLVGGVDALSQTTLRGFHSLQILSPVFCRPLSRERRGINIGEGAAYLLIEREGDAAARLLGVGESSDAHHMSAPDPDRRGRAHGDGGGARAGGPAARRRRLHQRAQPGHAPQRSVRGAGDHVAVRRARPGRVDQGLHGPPAGRGRRDRGGLRDRRHRTGLDPAQRRRRPGRRRSGPERPDRPRGHALPQRPQQLVRVRGQQRQPAVRAGES